MDESKRASAAAAMSQINRAWLDGRVEDLAPLVHSEMVTVFPDFAGRMQDREGFLAGFRDFCGSATIDEFQEYDQQVDIAGGTAVICFRYEMIYQRSCERYRVKGRDLWVFEQRDEAWIAVWRGLLEMNEEPA